MVEWFFPSRDYGAVEGFSNSGLEMFKGEPIRAMAREVCQNSLDAKKDNDQPLKIEFKSEFIRVADFPGMVDMRKVLVKCKEFWQKKHDEKTDAFIKNAIKTIEGDKFFILRISDYNTTGLKGAFDDNEFTPWKSLVQGDAFTVKSSDGAAGSYGIGKAAPFVVSNLQTVFYRTFDEDGVGAAQGVTHLVSFEKENSISGIDTVTRSTGYYGSGENNKPFRKLDKLDRLIERTEHGTDLFIPGFNFVTGRSTKWSDEIIIEILDNFLYSIYSGYMVVIVENQKIDKDTVSHYIKKYQPKTKHVAAFYDVIRENNRDVIEEIKPFYGLGDIRFRILYTPMGNKKVLVVRNSGMKISDISSLPKSVAFTGFLELRGDGINNFFRKMENPQHNKWEYKRHPEPKKAKQFKDEIENWVRDFIGTKIKEISGAEMDIDVSSYFLSSKKENSKKSDDNIEHIVDTVKSIDIEQESEPSIRKFKIKDIGGNRGITSTGRMKSGKIDDTGNGIGHRKRTGKKSGHSPSGRKGVETTDGKDSLYEQMREIYVSARIIKRSSRINKLIFSAKDNISAGELEIVTIGDNGKMLQLNVKNVKGINIDARADNGHIVIFNVKANEKCYLEFEVFAKKTYAMGVRAYGNKK